MNISLQKRLLRAFLVLLFATGLLNIAIPLFDLPDGLDLRPTVYFVYASLLAVAGSVLLAAPVRRRSDRWVMAIFLTAVISILPFYFTAKAFGTRDMQSILMTLSENHTGEMVNIGIGSFAPDIARIALLILALIVVAHLLVRQLAGFSAFLACLSVLTIVTSPLSAFAFRQLVPNPAHALIQPERDLVPPKILARPDQKKNLIIVYLESIERTYRDLPATQLAFGTLAAIEDRSISARNQQQVTGLHFTAGGMVGSQCGVPLLPRGMFSVGKKMHEKSDLAFPFSDFLPKLICIGDILHEDGYLQSYLNGSDLAVFSKGDFFLTHGFDRVFGLKSLPNWQDEPRQNLWGMDDDLLFEKLTDELRVLAAEGRPFTLATLTISTHGPDAFLDQSCDGTLVEGSLLPDAIRCTSAHVQDLIDEVDRLGLTDSTVIVVMSDHLAMENTLARSLEKMTDDRRDYVAILGAGPPRIIEKPGTTLDLYPTILEAMGYKIEQGKAYMGRSLLSDAKTLAETLGIEQLNDAVDGNATLQEFIWQ